jgi:ABC-2 type transport system permease protein
VKKTFAVARREFTSTVMTKGFLIGVAIMPALMFVVILVIPLLISDKPPKIDGTVAIIDLTGGAVAPAITEQEIRSTMESRSRAMREAIKGQLDQQLPAGPMTDMAKQQAAAALEAAATLPKIEVQVLSPSADLEEEKKPLAQGAITDGGRLLLVVIEADAVTPAEGKTTYGRYQIFQRTKLDDRIVNVIRDVVGPAIVEARIKASNLDSKKIMALTSLDAPRSTTVTASGERKSSQGTQMIVPFAFIFLLWVSAFSGGQYLLTTTIEEKSNRIMEVLLSAVSPLELMVGKIVGQMAVGLVILVAYATLGVGALVTFKMLDLLSAANMVYLIIFFLIAFFLIAAMMAAIGSAVSEVHEAQSLLTPVMIIFIIPMMLSPAIIRNPNSPMATVLSIVPPTSPFVMVMRLAASSEGVPSWQVALSIGVGLAAVCAAAWAAAKIFRIGVLMYGKPPNFGTLIKWVRMA